LNVDLTENQYLSYTVDPGEGTQLRLGKLILTNLVPNIPAQVTL